MTNIVKMPGSSDTPVVAQGAPNPELVEVLERLLDEAKNGEIRGTAYVCAKVAGRTSTGWNNASDTEDAIGYGILALMHRYGAACN